MTTYGAKDLILPDPSFHVRKDGGVENSKGVDVYSGSPQGALEYAQSQCSSGGLVQLDAGDFPITKQTRCWRHTLGIQGKTRLYPGTSLNQTMITLATSSPSVTNQLHGIVFGDMIIDGLVSKYPVSVDKSNIYTRKNFYGGVQLRHCKNVLLRDLVINDIPASHGIQLQASSYNTVRGCSIDTVGSESIFGAYGNGICSGEMYAGINAAYNLLEDCTIRNCSMVQVNWEPGNNNMARRVEMYGTRSGKFWDLDNKWKYCRAITVWQKGGFPASSSNKFDDCYYEGLGLAVSINGADTDLIECELVTTGANGENYSQVLYNGAKNASGKIKGCTFRPIKGQAAVKLADVKGMDIEGNDLKGSGGVGISGTASNSVIVGNKCVGFTSPVNVVGTGNTIDGNGPSVVLDGATAAKPPSSPPTEASEPVKKGGLNDASILGNLVRGGAVKWYNKAFGSSGNANEGSETQLVPPDGREWTYACIYISNLKAQGYDDLRAGFHDWQTTQAGMDAGAAVIAEKALLLLNAAELYGISVTLVIGGLSDRSTAARGFDLFDRDSELYAAFLAYAVAIADALYGTKIRLLELLNEADFIECVEKYWKSRPLAEFIAWSSQLVADVKAAQKRPGVPIGMGTAVDSTIYGMEWLREISGDTKIIDSMVGMCDVITVHSYVGEKGTTPFDIWKNQKVPAFVAAAKRLGKPLVFGETGRLYEGGTYDADMDEVLQASGSTYLWMVRRHDPKVYTIPAIPERPSHDTPAPDETPVEDPTSSDLIEPPAQETPETPVEVGDPNESGTEVPEPSEEPAVPSEGPGQEGAPPEVVEEPPAVEDGPPAVDPVTPDPSEPAEETPTDSTSSPTPSTGRNVLVELARRIAEILSRLFKRK